MIAKTNNHSEFPQLFKLKDFFLTVHYVMIFFSTANFGILSKRFATPAFCNIILTEIRTWEMTKLCNQHLTTVYEWHWAYTTWFYRFTKCILNNIKNFRSTLNYPHMLISSPVVYTIATFHRWLSDMFYRAYILHWGVTCSPT